MINEKDEQWLNDVLMEFSREGLATRLKLLRLDRDQTRQMLAYLFDDEITPEFLDGIYQETEGNPFFIEEVCKALIDSGKLYFEDGRWQRPSIADLEIPQSVRVAVQSRVGRLPKPVRETLQLAAIMGREFTFDLLAAASDLDEDNLAYQAALKQSRKYRGLDWQSYRQKMAAYLARRGFNYDVSKPVIEQVWSEMKF